MAQRCQQQERVVCLKPGRMRTLPQARDSEVTSATFLPRQGRHILVDSDICLCPCILLAAAWRGSSGEGFISLTVSYVASCQGWLRAYVGSRDYVKIKELDTAEELAMENAESIERAEEELEYSTQTS